ncbi:hypothetical protein HG530_014965 [Fusarium avenaceum]|nr:hypothetical protein HG530_014965 [Fusarium avenaceum]
MSRDQKRHDTRIHNPEVFGPVDHKLGVNDTAISLRKHSTCTDWVENTKRSSYGVLEKLQFLLVDLATILTSSLLSKRPDLSITAQSLLPVRESICAASIVVQRALTGIPKCELLGSKGSVTPQGIKRSKLFLELDYLAARFDVRSILKRNSCSDGFLLAAWSGHVDVGDCSIGKDLKIRTRDLDIGVGAVGAVVVGRVDTACISHSFGTVRGSVLARECLSLGHGFDHSLPVPARIAKGLPAIVLCCSSTVVGHEVEGRTATQDLTTVHGKNSIVGSGLRHRCEVPIIFGPKGSALHTRDVDLWFIPNCGSGFNEEDTGGGETLAKTCSDCYSSGTAANYDLSSR